MACSGPWMRGAERADAASPQGRIGFGLAVGALLAAYLAVSLYFVYFGAL